jgi:hypothetical protein
VNTAMNFRILKIEGISLQAQELLSSQVGMRFVELVNEIFSVASQTAVSNNLRIILSVYLQEMHIKGRFETEPV